MSDLVEVAPLSETYGRIEYELQLQLNAPSLQINKCYELSNAHVAAQFKTYCKNLNPQNIVDVFVPTSKLQAPSEIASKGVKVDPKKGFEFTVDNFEVDRQAEHIEVVRLQVALGNVLNFQSCTSIEDSDYLNEAPTATNLRPGYHSLRLSADGKFCVFNTAQILPCNLICFAGGENLEQKSDDDTKCDCCQQNEATIWCINDSAKFCADCDRESHTEKFTQKHKRIPITEARAMIEFCPVHKDQRVEYYCPQCNCPVCFQCKMVGSHSKGSAATHELEKIKISYQKAIDASEKEDPIITHRTKIIEQKLADADSKLEQITNNQKEIEEEIQKMAEAAIKRARELAGDKALIVKSVKCELERKKKELDDLAQSIQIQKKTAGPLTFLRSFDRHSMLVGSMQNVNDLPPDLRVNANIAVFGNIDVGTTDNGANRYPDSTAQSPRSRKSTGKRSPERQPYQNFQSTMRYDDFNNRNLEEEEEPSSATFADGDNYQQRDLNMSDIPRTQQTKGSKYPLKRKSDAAKDGPEYTSLIALAQRREQKNKARKPPIPLTFQPFQGTQIITNSQLCTVLYLCFPFKAQPQTHLLFSSVRDGRSIKKMHEMIDGIGITAVLVQKGNYVFGGFAAAKWNKNGQPFGEGSSSFLFSLSQDAFIPYKPRTPDSCQLYATEDSLTFGKYDLILTDDFDRCSAIIENSYGIGFTPGSTEAKTFLAGEPVFRADIVEVWGFFTIEQQ